MKNPAQSGSQHNFIVQKNTKPNGQYPVKSSFKMKISAKLVYVEHVKNVTQRKK